MIVADFIAEGIERSGIRHVFGVGGANIEDMFAAVQRRRPTMRAVLSKHEHAAGTAADAYARLTGGIGVVLATSGGGAMNLVHAIAEARASRVPLLAIVGEPPTEVQGAGAFQDTSGQRGALDAAAVFRAVSTCTRVARADDMPRLLAEALHAALGNWPGPAVLLIAKDLQRAEISPDALRNLQLMPKSAHPPDPASIRQAAALLRKGPVVIVAGDQVARAGAQRELAAIAGQLNAQVAVTPDGRDAFDNFAPRFLGVIGAMGTTEVASAIGRANVCLVVGTRLPLLARQGVEAMFAERPLVSLCRERPFVTSSQGLHVESEVLGGLRALATELHSTPSPSANETTSPALRAAVRAESGPFDSRAALAVIEGSLPTGGVVLVDAGNTGATTAHYLRAPREGRWLLAMGMAGMGYTFGAAIGAACATGRRCTVLAGDGAFFMNGLDIHTAVEHELPITYIVFNNSAHGMCLVRERVLLGENAGYNTFRRSHIGAGLDAMFPRLEACDCRTSEALKSALERAAQAKGPSLIAVELEDVEVPPFAAFQKATREGITTVSRGVSRDENS
jgi:acetolactate synthase-1/2/3 large subunit